MSEEKEDSRIRLRIVGGGEKSEMLAQLHDIGRRGEYDIAFRLSVEYNVPGQVNEEDGTPVTNTHEIGVFVTGVKALGSSGDTWQIEGPIDDRTIPGVLDVLINNAASYTAQYDTRHRTGEFFPEVPSSENEA